MSIVPMREMLANALKKNYAVGYFEAWDQYSLEAVLEAATECKSPVILGFGGVMMNQQWFGSGGLVELAAMGRVVAERAKVPVAYLLNEVLSFSHIEQGLKAGFNTVMLDTSHLPFDENITQTRKVVEAANEFGADVEGECDPLPDASGTMGEHAGSRKTDPNDAARFVAETGVRALSIAIGNEHIQTESKSAIDFDLLERLQKTVPVPLVIHGGTGFPDDCVQRAIELGVAKFNVGSIMKKLYLESVRDSMLSLTDRLDFQQLVGSHKPADFLEVAKNAVKDEVKRRLVVYNSAGKA
ncbi:MAG: class II fructose-bisphosphate aldolase [Armatimonadetes bacterium]|nr:class II fructose-bisphosphate aldolase [Armatimonadota bacterium]